MSDWMIETVELTEKTIALRSKIARAATVRAEAHLEICRGREALLDIGKRAFALHIDATKKRVDAAYFEATARLLEFVNSAGVEATRLEMMMSPN